jgi:hypothetical protein
MSGRKGFDSRRFLGMGNESDSLEKRVQRLEKGLYVDPGVDWVGRVVRERMLADLHALMLRQGAGSRATRTQPS